MERARRVRPFPYDRLDRVAQAQVEAGRALLSHLPLPSTDAEAVAAALGGPLAIRLVDVYAFPARELLARLPGPPVPVLARLAGGGGRAALLVIEGLLASRVARRTLGLDGDAPGEPRLSPAELRALASLLDPLCHPSGWRLEGFVADDDEILALFPDPLVLALDARVETAAGGGWVRALSPDRLRLQAPPPRAGRVAGADLGRLVSARVDLIVEIGRTLLSRGELASMATGDVVTFDRFGPRPPLGGPVRLRLGRGGFAAHLDGEGITVVKGFELGGPQMERRAEDEQQEAPREPSREAPRDPARDQSMREGAAAAGDALLRELPVEIVCELGRVTLSGRELLELRPGAVLPVGRPLAGPIDLSVGGRVVARGELVDVEGEIGVRLTQVND